MSLELRPLDAYGAMVVAWEEGRVWSAYQLAAALLRWLENDPRGRPRWFSPERLMNTLTIYEHSKRRLREQP